jgi:hypothetical protein
MPYITSEHRLALKRPDEHLLNPGELNYLITMLIKRYIHGHGLSYCTINDIVGALECAKLEFYRRIVGPYENGKQVENGDVY